MRRTVIRRLLLVMLLIATLPALAVESFIAPPQTSGSIAVQLHATAAVSANTPVVASFGVPFPRGSITQASLSQLRVRDGGTEIAAYVEGLTPWRHRSSAAVDGQSLRVVLIQVEVSFANPSQAKSIVVEFGGAPRTLSRPQRATRASTWAAVTSGSFVAADNVFEPLVYATLPASWLSRGVLRHTQSLTFDASNTAARDSPAAMDAIATWPGTQET